MINPLPDVIAHRYYWKQAAKRIDNAFLFSRCCGKVTLKADPTSVKCGERTSFKFRRRAAHNGLSIATYLHDLSPRPIIDRIIGKRHKYMMKPAVRDHGISAQIACDTVRLA